MPRASAEQAVAHEAGDKKLAKVLDVHFLVRGTVARSGGGYTVTVLGIDGDSERVIATHNLSMAADELTPHWHGDGEDAIFALTRAGLQAEVKRARDKSVDALDVRDLSFRAIMDWRAHRDTDGKTANANANALLNRALAMVPDDQFTLRTVAQINLCDCVNAWSDNPDEQKAIGAAAMDKYLRVDPNSPFMLYEKASLYQLRLRWEESLVIADAVLEREPANSYFLSLKAVGLLRLRRLKEAQLIVDGLLSRYPSNWGLLSETSDIYFAEGDYTRAAQLAQKAVAQMSEPDLRDRVSGSIRLTQIASEARLGHDARAKAALADFEPLYDGLRLAGASN